MQSTRFSRRLDITERRQLLPVVCLIRLSTILLLVFPDVLGDLLAISHLGSRAVIVIEINMIAKRRTHNEKKVAQIVAPIVCQQRTQCIRAVSVISISIRPGCDKPDEKQRLLAALLPMRHFQTTFLGSGAAAVMQSRQVDGTVREAPPRLRWLSILSLGSSGGTWPGTRGMQGSIAHPPTGHPTVRCNKQLYRQNWIRPQ